MKKFWCCLWLPLISFSVLADDSGHPLPLWEISGKSNSVFLLGSIHLLREQDYPLPSKIYDAYDEAERLIMELDMDDLDPIESQSLLREYGMIENGGTLSDLMGTEKYAQAERAAAKIDIPLELLERVEPWYAAITVELLMVGRLGFDPTLGVETHLMQKAQADGKRIDGLETMREQLGFLDGMSIEAQQDMLLATLTESGELANLMDDMMAAWHTGDVDALSDMLLDEMAQHEELNAALLINRNANWIKKIEPLLNDEEDYLIVVGALHLIGPDGVPEQLGDRGFDVRQLSEPAAVR